MRIFPKASKHREVDDCLRIAKNWNERSPAFMVELNDSLRQLEKNIMASGEESEQKWDAQDGTSSLYSLWSRQGPGMPCSYAFLVAIF